MQWVIVSLIRLLVPISIFRWPFWGSVAAIIADNLDVVILDFLRVTNFDPYNLVDKSLDTYIYLIQGYTVLAWKDQKAKKIALFLLLYRIIGVIIYELTSIRELLFIFPNVFVFFYLYFVFVTNILKKKPFKKSFHLVAVLIILTVLKLAQEYILHVAQVPIYHWIKANFLFFL